MDKKQSYLVFGILFLLFVICISFQAFSHVKASISDGLYGGKTPLDSIVIVAIDDSSIQEIGRWPWNRDVFAQLIDKTKDAKAIGIDVSFFEESNNDKKLIENLDKSDNIILASEINGEVLYKPIFNSSYGYVNLVTDGDGITRSLENGLDDNVLPFAFEVYKKGWNNKSEFKSGRYNINFVNSPNSFTMYSASDVLKQNISFEDKIVLIGASAPNLHDNYFVPSSNGVAMPGVEIHANIIQNLILDNFIKEQSKIAIIILVLLFGSIGMFLLSRMKIIYSVLIIIGILIVYSLIGIYLFNHNYLIDLFFVPASLIIFTGVGMGVNYLDEKKNSAFLADAFGRYVNKDLLGQIKSNKNALMLGGVQKEVTVFFSDIRGFTSISEKLTPVELVSFINEYLTGMTDVILKHHGTVDKFIGDAIMAFWNAPLDQKDHAILACESALEQNKTLEKLKKDWKDRKLPDMAIGCGINTGEAVVGNMGSNKKFNYTAMGDTVNLASRLESLTKYYGVSIIISENTYKFVKDKFECRMLDKVKVKGKKIPINLYELCIKSNKEFNDKYEEALKFYFEKNWKKAIKLFEEADKIDKDNVSCKVFIERCEMYSKESPGEDWDGSFEMKNK